MGFWSWLFGEKRAALDTSSAETAGEESGSAAALLSAIVGTGEINSNTAMEVPAFSAAVNFISDTVAGLPVKLYRESREENKTDELTDDPRLALLNEATGDLMGAFESRKAQVTDMLLHGAGYVYVNREGLDVKSLHYVRHCDVAVHKNYDPIFKDAKLLINGGRYDPWQFVILARNSTDGVTGRSMVEQHKTLLSTMYNSMKYENTVSRTGGNKKGFLQSERQLSKAALAETRRAWEEIYANNGNNMMLLNNGLKYVPSASSAVEMQLNQNKLTNSAQIDLSFLLSPEVISGRATPQQFTMAITTAVLPVVRLYQEAINRTLLLESEKRQMYFALDTTELLKADVLTRYQAYAVGLQNNFLQLDEVRYKEDLPATGFNYIKLGLQDVLLDPATGRIYTPNTNQMVEMGGDISNSPENGLISSDEDGIIEVRKKLNWVKGAKGYFAGSVSNGLGGRARMTKEEYDIVCSEIITTKPMLHDGDYYYHFYGNHFYTFSVVEPGTYKFDMKISIAKGSGKINSLRSVIDGED